LLSLFINLTPIFYNPPPLSPSLSKGGGRIRKRAVPLSDAPKIRELKRGKYGVPAKTKFLWGKKLLLIKYFFLP
jgi:hypothetical protein